MSDILRPAEHFKFHWRQAKAEFWREWQRCFEEGQSKNHLLIVLGTIRGIYWQSLGQGVLPVARAISAWWHKLAPLHQMGEVIL